MREFSVISLAAMDTNKTSRFQVRDQLAYLARHIGNVSEENALFQFAFIRVRCCFVLFPELGIWLA
jgi:hypothetical protein